MNGWIVIMAHQLMEVPGVILIRERELNRDCCAAVPGSLMRPTAVLPADTLMLRGISTAISVFELCMCRRGLLSPLPSYPLTSLRASPFTLPFPLP
jgi:hypothetical protein